MKRVGNEGRLDSATEGPHGASSLPAQIFHHWVQPLFDLGYDRPLNEEDLKQWPLDLQDDPVLHGTVFKDAADAENPVSVNVRAGIRAVLGYRYCYVGLWKILYLFSILGQPILLYRLLMDRNPNPNLLTPTPTRTIVGFSQS